MGYRITEQYFRDMYPANAEPDFLPYLVEIARKESNFDLYAVRREDSYAARNGLNPEDVVSYGLGQIQLRNIPGGLMYPGLLSWDMTDAASVEEQSETQIRAMGAFFMTLMIRNRGDYRSAVRSWNGAGPAAERYADEIMSRVGGDPPRFAGLAGEGSAKEEGVDWGTVVLAAIGLVVAIPIIRSLSAK